jgi:hypothetical protein
MDSKWLDILGLVTAMTGAIVLACGLAVSRKEALRIGVSRMAEETDEMNINLPHVRHTLRQSRFALIGLILLSVGFLLQIAASFLH